jgi:membrane protease YdiL (CAAX protease family)
LPSAREPATNANVDHARRLGVRSDTALTSSVHIPEVGQRRDRRAHAVDIEPVGVATFPQWGRLLAGLLAIFTVFQWSATALGSDRGQAGLLVAGLVVATTLVVEGLWLRRRSPASTARAIGLDVPRRRGVAVSTAVSLLVLLTVPAYAWATGVEVTFDPRTPWLLPGLFAQAGIAEEVVFRGYLFGHLRSGRTFWRAAGLSMLPFVAVHLLMFRSMPWPVALAGLILSVVVSFPLAHLFELGGATIWAPALMHFVVQGAIKVVIISGDASALFPFMWIAVSAVLPMVVLLIPRPSTRDAGAWP